MSALKKSSIVQNEIIDFFRKEQEQEKVSNWVFLFNIIRYIFTQKNISIVVVVCFLYLTAPFIITSFNNFSKSRNEIILVQKEENKIMNTEILKRILEKNNEQNYLQVVELVEKDIENIYKNHVFTLSKYNKPGRVLSIELGIALKLYTDILEKISNDKQMFTIVVESAKVNNDKINELNQKRNIKYFELLELYRTKNYNKIFDSYLEFNNKIEEYKQKELSPK